MSRRGAMLLLRVSPHDTESCHAAKRHARACCAAACARRRPACCMNQVDLPPSGWKGMLSETRCSCDAISFPKAVAAAL